MPELSLIALAVLTITSGSAHAQSWNMVSDLSQYRVESVHQDWRVLCTPNGVSAGSTSRDCIMEDRLGFIIFAHPNGYYGYTMRGFVEGDGMLSQDFAEAPDGIVVTYDSPSFFEDFVGTLGGTRGGAPFTVSPNGIVEAHRRALAMMGDS